MRSWLTTLFFATLLSCFGAVTIAQTPSRAIDLYKQGALKLDKGELDVAIDDFTRAIELSSRLVSNKRSTHSTNWKESAESSESASVTVVDPFTARAYNGRGLARFRKKDFEGAIEDFNQAIRIRPGMVEPYLNRGAAKSAIGDST